MKTRIWGFIAIIALIGLMRLPVLELVPDRDVTTYAVIGRGIRWLVTSPDADALRGQLVLAQREVAKRGLLPGWPPQRDE